MVASKLYLYNCPVRGQFSSRREEDRVVIDCLNWLINDRRVPVTHILVDKVLAQIGSKGRNSIKPDIIIFSSPKKDALNAEGKINKDKVVLLAEIKVSPKDKDSAIKHQLLPAVDMCKNAVGGIYWDSAARNFVSRDGDVSTILSLPENFIQGKGEISIIKAKSLMSIGKGVAIWNILDQALRNHQGLSKSEAYEDLFKILTSKYYDETKNINYLKFQVAGDSAGVVQKRIIELYEEANKFYRLDENLVGSVQMRLSPKALMECVKILEGYSLKKTSRAIIQEFYMQFAPQFLKQDLQQYYTPKEIVSFMTESISLKSNTFAIDPCCGTGDFMVGVLRAAKSKNVGEEIEKCLYCWDIDKNAAKLAQINMILNGDGRTNVEVRNSLDEWNRDAEYYDYVITNPPFGTGTKYEEENIKHYDLGNINNRQTGKLFLERGLNLLKEGGCLISIVPVGYIDNPSDDSFREILFKRSRIIGAINLPAGTFKEAGTDVSTAVLILQKGKPPTDYRIFTAVANEVGYDVTKKGAPLLIERNEDDGAYIFDENNQFVIRNDLVAISEQLKTFTLEEKIDRFDKPNKKLDYSYTTFKDIKENGYAINAKIYDRCTGYLPTVEVIKKGKYFCLADHDHAIEVSNSDSFKKESGKEYQYIETGDVYRDNLKKNTVIRGWKLPGRAKQIVKEDDILVAKMGGSSNNFLYCIASYQGAVASNGFYKVWIEDELLRLSFFYFLFSPEYEIQSRALPTGTIMADIKEKDFSENMYIPILESSGIEKVKKYLNYKRQFIDMMIS